MLVVQVLSAPLQVVTVMALVEEAVMTAAAGVLGGGKAEARLARWGGGGGSKGLMRGLGRAVCCSR
eukprot:1017894-Prorocentrum_minimum.AAC.2